MCKHCAAGIPYEDDLGNSVIIFELKDRHAMCFENTEWGGSGIIEISHCPFCGERLDEDDT